MHVAERRELEGDEPGRDDAGEQDFNQAEEGGFGRERYLAVTCCSTASMM
jgi:hypothetical protein